MFRSISQQTLELGYISKNYQNYEICKRLHCLSGYTVLKIQTWNHGNDFVSLCQLQ